MRRHVLLLVAIAALVAAVALLRPRQTVEPQAEAPAPANPGSEAPRADNRQDEIEYARPDPAPISPIVPGKVTSARPAPQLALSSEPNTLTVVDPQGDPVPDAVVFLITHAYGNRSESKCRELRTDENGELKIVLGVYDRAHFISYRLGVGSGITGELRAGVDTTLKYEKNLAVAFKCVAPHGVALESAEVVLTTEVTFGERRDANGNVSPFVVQLPPRKLLTDREGLCTFGTVLAPRQIRTVWPPVPGLRNSIKATWHTMSALEKIEKPPAGAVTLVLDQ